MQPNAFSETWYETFLFSIPETRTATELRFVRSSLPVGTFPGILDLCCGPARHAVHLIRDGYRIHGVDASELAIEQAREACPEGRFDVLDMRGLDTLAGPYDAAINLWHSFGYYDDETNLSILRNLFGLLRPRGRAVFDLYNDRYLAHTEEVWETERAGRTIRTRRHQSGARLQVFLEYDDQEGDRFDWRLYAPDEFQEHCKAAGFRILLRCTRFDEANRIGPEDSRMQFILERP